MRCEYCGTEDNVFIDHDHKTNMVRGYLCVTHNSAIGMLGDDIDGLMKAVEYLRRPQTESYEKWYQRTENKISRKKYMAAYYERRNDPNYVVNPKRPAAAKSHRTTKA